MSPLRRIFNLFRVARIDEDVRQEVDTHLALIEDEEYAQGVSAEQARRRARARFGSPLVHRERAHDAVFATGIEDAWKDVRLAARSLARSPGFTIVALLTLALGIGANTAMFSIVNGVLLRPLGYPQPERLMYGNTRFPTLGFSEFSVSVPEYLDFQRINQSFAEIGALRAGSVNVSAGDRALRVRSAAVDEHLLNALGVRPLEGRLFASGETAANAPLPGPPGAPARALAPPPVVMLSFELWQRAFGARPIVGQSIDVDSRRLEVIGIMPRGFDVVDNRTEIWLPLGIAPFEREQRGSHNLFLIGRLKDGVTLEAARAEIDTLMENWGDRIGLAPGNGPIGHVFAPASGPASEALVKAGLTERMVGHVLQIAPLADQVVGSARQSIWALQAAVVFVLLIACANLGNLLLARAETRRREFAVRAALGASRGRLLRHSLMESVLLSIAGGALGFWLARVGLQAVVRAFPTSLPRMREITLDLPVLLFTMAVSIGVGLLFGLAPVAHIRLKSLITVINEHGARGGTGGVRHRVRGALVMAEVAFAVMVVMGAGLLVRTVSNLVAVDAGFDRSRLVTFALGLPLATTEPADRFALYQNVLGGLRAIPGVEGATAMTGLPPNRPFNANGLEIDGHASAAGTNAEVIDYFQNVMSSYFETMGIPIVQGRGFQAADAASTGRLVIVNEAFARKIWNGRDPIGQRVRPCCNTQLPWSTVIGVARDVKQGGVDQQAGTELYTFIDQTRGGPFTMNMVARTSLPLTAIAQTVERIVREKDPTVPIINLREMDEVFAESIQRPRLLAQLLASFAGLALLLAAVGTYGILSYMVTERRREIGIRLALGADRSSILADVVRQGLTLTVAGLAIGLAGALGLGRLIGSLLFGVQPTDATTFAVVVGTMTVVAILACWLPAWRASRLDPILVLRDE